VVTDGQRTDSFILDVLGAFEAHVQDTSLSPDGTGRRVEMYFTYGSDVFVRPEKEFIIPLRVFTWKRTTSEQAAIDRNGAPSQVLAPGANSLAGNTDSSSVSMRSDLNGLPVDVKDGVTISDYLSGIQATNIQIESIEVRFSVAFGYLDTIASVASPLPSGLLWPPLEPVSDYIDIDSLVGTGHRRLSAIDVAEGSQGEWAQGLLVDAFPFPSTIASSNEGGYQFMVVLADSRHLRSWLRPSYQESIEARLLPDDDSAVDQYISDGITTSTGESASKDGDIADVTIVRDPTARGAYVVTMQFRKTGAGRLVVKAQTLSSNGQTKGPPRVIRMHGGKLRLGEQETTRQSKGVHVEIIGASCDANAGLVQDESQLRCVCAAGYFKFSSQCAPCPVGTEKLWSGNDTRCSSCQSEFFSLGRQYPCARCPQSVDGLGGINCING